VKGLNAGKFGTKMPSMHAMAKSFFDREAVIKAVNAAELKALRYQGGYVRKAAQESIRNGKGKGKSRRSSKPGETPRSQTGRLRRFIMFAHDRSTNSVVVGPATLGGKGKVPQVLEYGGISRIALTRPKLGKGHKASGAKRRFRWEKTGQFKNVVIARRPFMGPALTRSGPKLAAIWRDSIRK